MADRIAEDLIREIISANDITELISKYVTLKRSGSGLVGLCPFHKEKTPSFHVSPERQLYHCFGCNSGGNIVDFVKNIENLDFIESIRFLADRAGINIDTSGFSEEDKRLYKRRQDILQANREAARYFHECLFSEKGAAAREYAKKRGLTKQTVTTFGLGFAPDGWDNLTRFLTSKGFSSDILVGAGLSLMSEKGRVYDRFRDRFMFPIIDIRGNVIGFGGRIMGDGQPKYLNSPETMVFNKRKNLFALNLAKNTSNGELILAEGYMDVVSLHQSGIKNAVASLGTALTTEQARLISRFAAKVILCYDTDEAGVNATARAIEVFDGLDVKVKVLSLPKGKDPDEYIRQNGAENFKQQASGSLSVSEYKIKKIAENYDLSDSAQKAEYAGKCAEVISQLGSEIERDVLKNSLANETGISLQAIDAEIKKLLGRKQYREKKKIIKETITASPRQASGASDAEKRLISLCATDHSVYEKLKEDIVPELFTDDMLSRMLYYINENTEPGIIISKFPEREADAAAALSMPLCYENNLKAAKDLIDTIKREKHELLLKKAIAEGDTELMNSLILKKGGGFEGGN